MWYYKQTEPNLWTVGYGEGKNWTTDSDHDNRNDARQRVAFLNGNGGVSSTIDALNEQLAAAKADYLLVDRVSQKTATEFVTLRTHLRRTISALRNAPVSPEIIEVLGEMPVVLLDDLFGPLDEDSLAEQSIVAANDLMMALTGGI